MVQILRSKRLVEVGSSGIRHWDIKTSRLCVVGFFLRGVHGVFYYCNGPRRSTVSQLMASRWHYVLVLWLLEQNGAGRLICLVVL